jgi:3-hydroxyisobutyrate dehydrogenase-like beta-hydroxyacid dehydrogenase
MKKPHIGFIGTGVMGAPMAQHLSKAGYAVTIYDINRESMERVAAENDSIHRYVLDKSDAYQTAYSQSKIR